MKRVICPNCNSIPKLTKSKRKVTMTIKGEWILGEHLTLKQAVEAAEEVRDTLQSYGEGEIHFYIDGDEVPL